MKILHVTTGLGIGGAETVLCRLIGSCRGSNFEHAVISLTGADELRERIVAAGADVAQLNWTPGLHMPGEIVALRRAVGELCPDIVHGWMYHGNLGATIGTLGRDIPMIWGIRQSLYDIRDQKTGTAAVIRLCAWLSQRPARIVFNSATSAEQHHRFGYDDRRRMIIPNGFDTDAFKPDSALRARQRAELGVTDDEFVVGVVARFHPDKDHDTFLDAAARFCRTATNARFVLVGKGMSRENTQLLARINTLGIDDRVLLCGYRADTPAFNVSFDASVCSSRVEAFPNSVGEAMACAVPCVATDVGDVGSLLGEAGIRVPPQDAEALAQALVTLWSLDASQRKRLGEQARSRIEESYSLQAMTDAYMNLYIETEKNHRCAE
jgi:glycosyltransferase involved in cell wall biosynthesis